MNKHLPILDLARAGAACWVMIAHLTLIGGSSVFFISQGNLGVEVFIFISGFLMTLILKGEAQLSVRSVRQFYIRRFFRIAPSFYLAVLFYVALRPFFTSGLIAAEALFRTPYQIPGLHDVVTWRSVMLNLLFAHGLYADEAGRIFGPAWSLSLEMQFYLVAPFCVWCFRRWPAVTMTLLFAVNYAANLLFGVYGHAGLITNFGYPSFLPNRIFLFLLGGSYAMYLFERRRRDLFALIASTAGLFLLVSLKSWLVCLLLMGFIHAAISGSGAWRRFWVRVAEAKPTQLMAEWSYGIYLYHMLCMGVVGHFLVGFGTVVPARFLWITYAIIVIACAILLSALLHYTVERPARDFGKRLTRTRRGNTSAPEAASLAG